MNNNTAEQADKFPKVLDEIVKSYVSLIWNLETVVGKPISIDCVITNEAAGDKKHCKITKLNSAPPSPSTEAIVFAQWMGESRYDSFMGKWYNKQGECVAESTAELYHLFKQKTDK